MNTPTIAPGDGERVHYMDNLRALAMLAGVVFHAALAYSVLVHPFWPTADAGNSVAVDVAAWFLHLFRMPLFFVIAGFFAAMLVRKRGVGGMLGNRYARILLPFVVFWPIIHLAMGWLTMHAAANVEHPSPVLAMITPWLADPNRPAAPPTLVHLWFLPYLMCFCILVWVVDALEIRAPGRWLRSMTPAVLAIAIPVALVLPLYAVPAPHPAPESLFPQWWALVLYGVYFAFGYQMFHRPELPGRLAPLAPILLCAALIAYAGLCVLLREPQGPGQDPLVHAARAFLEATSGFWMTLVCLVYGKRWLDRSHRILRYVSDASYWVYLVHLPILFAIQYPLLDVDWPWGMKFAVSTLATFAACLLSYHVLIRGTRLGRLLGVQASTAFRTSPQPHPGQSPGAR